MQVSTHNQDTPAANKQHKIEDQLPEYFNHGRILARCPGEVSPGGEDSRSASVREHVTDTGGWIVVPLCPALPHDQGLCWIRR